MRAQCRSDARQLAGEVKEGATLQTSKRDKRSVIDDGAKSVTAVRDREGQTEVWVVPDPMRVKIGTVKVPSAQIGLQADSVDKRADTQLAMQKPHVGSTTMIKKSIPTALALLCLTSTVALAEGGLPIIDMHMHAKDVMRGPDGKAMPVPCQPQPCERRPAAADTADRVFELTLQAMKRHNIVKAFLSDYPQTMVYKWVEAAPDRFIPSAGVVKPGDPTPQFLRAEHKAGRLRGIGEIGAQYSGIPPNDASLEPYFALAEELDLPVLIHTLGIGAPHRSFRSAAGNPLLLEDVLVRHPKLRLYVENAGYPYLGEAIAIMSQYPQLYADVSTITWIIPREAFHDYLRALVRAGLGKRLMFGSDQMQWPETIELAVEGIESADFLNREQKRDIFYNNAARFLRLDKQPSE